MMGKQQQIKSIHLRGILKFNGNPKSNFRGPLHKGLRPLLWLKKIEGEATSCALVSDVQISEGESKEVELFVLNEFQLKTSIMRGMTLSIGSLGKKVQKFAEFEVLEHLGEWKGGRLD